MEAALMKKDKMIMKDVFSLFRRNWTPTEVPICIIGSTIHHCELLHAVRIRTFSEEEDIEAIKKNPGEGLHKGNFRIVPTSTVTKAMPQLLIEYYQGNILMAEDAKDDETREKDAKNAKLLQIMDVQKLFTRAESIRRDMIDVKALKRMLQEDEDSEIAGSTNQVSDENPSKSNSDTETQNRKRKVEDRLNLKSKLAEILHSESKISKVMKEMEKEMNKPVKPELSEKETMAAWKNKKDMFGLPDSYSTDSSDYGSSSSDSESDSSELSENVFVEDKTTVL